MCATNVSLCEAPPALLTPGSRYSLPSCHLPMVSPQQFLINKCLCERMLTQSARQPRDARLHRCSSGITVWDTAYVSAAKCAITNGFEGEGHDVRVMM